MSKFGLISQEEGTRYMRILYKKKALCNIFNRNRLFCCRYKSNNRSVTFILNEIEII